ncbi:serine hydrolase [Solwaraspora sp. WMMD1047]|uniref:serine hydrolase domain-containing protein n=1 Tax=Solwaraspora sp. WMMD1047 TaxID=3016102 RepID=UPI0024164351|nr:serine hydrolase domain-containing protein [Solwaraspora sp. WMMD1047]MDG4832073.1 serine hydrolase [Solwaraspora sp. WMMD1047]
MTPGLTAALDAYRRRTRTPGIGVALVPAVGEPTVAVGGERVRGQGDPVEPADRWHIGSCMKAMTAVVVARFVDRGELAWSTPVAELFDADAAHPGWRAVTLAEVLTHTAGVPANPTADELRAALTDPTPLPVQRSRLARQTLDRPPGPKGRFRYSNLGYTLVGAALERRTGAPFEEVLAAEVLRPLGMTTAGFGPPAADQPWGHRARFAVRGLGVGRGPAVGPADRSLRHPPDNPPVLSPAGRLHLGLSDWAAFIRIFLARPESLVSAGSLERIVTPPAGAEQGMGWWVPGGGSLRYRVAYAQQGSNARWVATAVVSPDRSAAALITCNDGRTRILTSVLNFGIGLLPPAAPHPQPDAARTR